MECSSVVLIEPVPGIERQEFDLGSFGQIGGLVDDEASGLDSGLQRHVITVPPRPLLHNPARAAQRTASRRAFLRYRRRRKWRPCSAKAGADRSRTATR